MTLETHASHGPDPAAPSKVRPAWWRLGTPLAVLACGVLFVVSAQNSDGTDLRPGRYTNLASLVGNEARRTAGMQDRAGALTDDVKTLASSVDDKQVTKLQSTVERLSDPAGLTPHEGAGITVTLSDAPEDVIYRGLKANSVNPGSVDPNVFAIHQQDVQAVVNAMWAGGATAITIQGQRVITTTGIKCEGNAIQLQGIPYPSPYVISAVGDPAELARSIENEDYVQRYRSDVEDPDIAVGFDLEAERDLKAPAYDGLLDLSYATPLG